MSLALRGILRLHVTHREVEDFDLAKAINHDIVTLDITVQDVLVVDRLNSLRNLVEREANRGFRKALHITIVDGFHQFD